MSAAAAPRKIEPPFLLFAEAAHERDSHRDTSVRYRDRRAVSALSARSLPAVASHRDGAADALARAPARQRAGRACRLLLRAARLGRADRQRGDADFAAGA